MYAHVTTYRLSSEEETLSDRDRCHAHGLAVMDQTARTIASWYQSPNENSKNLLALSQGRPFDTHELRSEIAYQVSDTEDQVALWTWLGSLEELLSN